MDQFHREAFFTVQPVSGEFWIAGFDGGVRRIENAAGRKSGCIF